MDQRTTQAELLPHAARELSRRAVGERGQASAAKELRNANVALGGGLSEQAAEKFDILPDAEVGIEVPAEPLGHVGDARAYLSPVGLRPHVTAEHSDIARLNLTRPGNGRQQGRLTHAVGAYKACHDASRDRQGYVVESSNTLIPQAQMGNIRNGLPPPLDRRLNQGECSVPCHRTRLFCSMGGHGVFGSSRT
jgi:hypothetical protein